MCMKVCVWDFVYVSEGDCVSVSGGWIVCLCVQGGDCVCVSRGMQMILNILNIELGKCD